MSLDIYRTLTAASCAEKLLLAVFIGRHILTTAKGVAIVMVSHISPVLDKVRHDLQSFRQDPSDLDSVENMLIDSRVAWSLLYEWFFICPEEIQEVALEFKHLMEESMPVLSDAPHSKYMTAYKSEMSMRKQLVESLIKDMVA